MTRTKTDETEAPTCTYKVGGHLEESRPCGVTAAVRCEFGDTESYPEFIYYCIRHFQVAYDFINRDENRIFTLGVHEGNPPSYLLD